MPLAIGAAVNVAADLRGAGTFIYRIGIQSRFQCCGGQNRFKDGPHVERTDRAVDQRGIVSVNAEGNVFRIINRHAHTGPHTSVAVSSTTMLPFSIICCATPRKCAELSRQWSASPLRRSPAYTKVSGGALSRKVPRRGGTQTDVLVEAPVSKSSYTYPAPLTPCPSASR